MDIRTTLINNIREFIDNAEEDKNKKAYNSAVTLYFKAIAVLTDLFIYELEGHIPSNHSERFKILKTRYFEIYKILDKTFPIYQDSYRLRMSLKHVEELENDVKKLIKLTKINI